MKKATNKELAEWFREQAKGDNDMTITAGFQRDIAKRLDKLADLEIQMALVESEVDESNYCEDDE